MRTGLQKGGISTAAELLLLESEARAEAEESAAEAQAAALAEREEMERAWQAHLEQYVARLAELICLGWQQARHLLRSSACCGHPELMCRSSPKA